MKKILFLLLCVATSHGQIVPTGQETAFDYGIQNTASQLDDNATYITVQTTDGIQGKSNSSTWAKKIYVDNVDVKKAFLSTGLIKNGLVTTNADPTKFNITAGIGIITNFDNPEVPTSTIVSFPAFTGITPTYLTTSNITYVAITLSGGIPVVLMQATAFDNVQRRNVIALGAVIHSNLSTINLVNNISAPTNAGTNQLHDLYEFIGALNLTGNKYTSNGANLSLNKTAGTIGKLGVNFANNWRDPNRLSIGLQSLLTFRYRTQNGTEGSDVTTLNPSVYDLSNVLTAVPSNKFSIQTVTLFQTGMTRIQYGQNVYNTLAEAESAILTRSYVVENNIAMNGIARAYIILKNTTTSLQNASDAKIVEAQKFGGIVSGGAAITDAAIIAALGYTPENLANKQNSLAVDGSGVKYPTVDAVNGGLAAKIGGTGTSNFIPKFTASGTLGDSFSQDLNGTKYLTGTNDADLSYGIGKGFSNGNSVFFGWRYNGGNPYGFIETYGSTSPFSIQSGGGRTLIGTTTDNGVDQLQVNGTISATSYAGTATLTGTPTAPTATVGTNTTQIATTAFVNSSVTNSNYWTKTTDDIINNNIGKVVVKGTNSDSRIYLGDSVLTDMYIKVNQGIGSFGLYNSTNNLAFFTMTSASVPGSFNSGGEITATSRLNINTGSYFWSLKHGGDNSLQITNESSSGSISLQVNTDNTVLLPSVTNNLISAETTGKAIITKEYVNRIYTVATLPTPSSGVAYATVTDATSPTYLGTLTGGGSVVCPVFYNGTAWVSH